jgi:hypothetical protein
MHAQAPEPAAIPVHSAMQHAALLLLLLLPWLTAAALSEGSLLWQRPWPASSTDQAFLVLPCSCLVH